MIELLVESGITDELIERTSSTARVQAVVQASLTPVFLLAAIGAVLNVINMRLVWLAERIDRIERLKEADSDSRDIEELPALRRRASYAAISVNLSTFAALLICTIIAMGFISAFIRPALGTVVAIAWILTMGMIVAALLFFLLETRMGTKTRRERRRIAHQIAAHDTDD